MRYDIRIRQNQTDVVTIGLPGTATRFDFATLSRLRQPGVYQIEVHVNVDSYGFVHVHVYLHNALAIYVRMPSVYHLVCISSTEKG